MSSQGLTDRLKELARPVDSRLEELVRCREGIPKRLGDAMLYSLMGGGKRLRPALCLAASELCGKGPEVSLDPACAVEMVHTYSLIHDDLPAMDDDEMRRGRPSCHKAFDEAAAILAGDALLTLAFEVLAGTVLPERSRCALVYELSSAAGGEGMTAGQVLDLEGEKDASPTPDSLLAIHNRKTMRLIRASVRMGVIAADGDADVLDALTTWAEKAGLAFQVADDILDEISTPEQLGKSVGKDRDAGKATAVKVWGLDGAREQAERLAAEAERAVEGFQNAAFFRQIARFFVERTN